MLGSDSRIYSNYYENPGQLVRSLNLTIFYILYPSPHISVEGVPKVAVRKVQSKRKVLERPSRNNLTENGKNKHEIEIFQYMLLLDVFDRFKI